jgi:hypothetical protein
VIPSAAKRIRVFPAESPNVWAIKLLVAICADERFWENVLNTVRVEILALEIRAESTINIVTSCVTEVDTMFVNRVYVLRDEMYACWIFAFAITAL